MGSREEGFFVSHHALDLIFHRRELRFQIFLHALQFQEFLDLVSMLGLFIMFASFIFWGITCWILFTVKIILRN